jgi:hypothetical protein
MSGRRIPVNEAEVVEMVDSAARLFAEKYWADVNAALREELAQRERERSRRYWSGPNRMERRLLKGFGLTSVQLGLAAGSVLRTMRRRKR